MEKQEQDLGETFEIGSHLSFPDGESPRLPKESGKKHKLDLHRHSVNNSIKNAIQNEKDVKESYGDYSQQKLKTLRAQSISVRT